MAHGLRTLLVGGLKGDTFNEAGQWIRSQDQQKSVNRTIAIG